MFQAITTSAVTEGYSAVRKHRNNTTGSNEESVLQYFYGELSARYNGIPSNYTYQYPIRPLSINPEDAILDFTLYIVYAASTNGSWGPAPTYTPIRELDRKDSTVILFFLSTNQVDFMGDSGDAWYTTHTRISDASKVFDPMYRGSQPASPLGCVEQHQLCNLNDACTPLFASWHDSLRHIPHLWPHAADAAAVAWAYELALRLENSVVGVVGKLAAAALASSATRAAGVQSPLAPDGQWQRDVERFHNISMAGVQRRFVETATGPADPAMRAFLRRPPRPGGGGAEWLCRNQMIRSNAHANFSVFGLALVFVVGSFFVSLSWALESLVQWVQGRRKLDVYARFEWTMNETLQLQRQAHEGLEIGSWSGCDKGVPVAGSMDRLAVIDLEDLTHPKLKAPPPPVEEVPSSSDGEIRLQDV
ncbi:putative cytochrome p450 [Diplodia seriata]|uniref:Putative cytochrome p450 n=1 Tax=Diplodia seriata TaxID=420778 RepID=A0A0G2DQR9_9PEZI|nr:putative cytochrome p450 [Diplodia seriata]